MVSPKKNLLRRLTRSKFWSVIAPKKSSPKNLGQSPKLITKTAALSSSSLVRRHLQRVISRHRDSLAKSSLANRLTFSATAPK